MNMLPYFTVCIQIVFFMRCEYEQFYKSYLTLLQRMQCWLKFSDVIKMQWFFIFFVLLNAYPYIITSNYGPMKINRVINLIKRRYSPILGVPNYPNELPEAEHIIPGHTLIKPAKGMLKSAVKFPQEGYKNFVYGNLEDLGMTYGNTNQRVLYTDFRKANKLLATILDMINTKGERESRRSKKTKYRDRSNQYSSRESDPVEDDSDIEKNPGNPFTIFKNKYKQNWLWNHYMDGDHMNLNPYGPEFNILGPKGTDLLYGRKWWYFNQDDYKPMG